MRLICGVICLLSLAKGFSQTSEYGFFREQLEKFYQLDSDSLRLNLCYKLIYSTLKKDDQQLSTINGLLLLNKLITDEQQIMLNFNRALSLCSDQQLISKALVYSYFGQYYFTKSDFKNALDCYLKVKKFGESEPNLSYFVNKYIILIKFHLGLYEESKKITKENIDYIYQKKQWNIKDSFELELSFYYLVHIYERTQQLDSAKYHFNFLKQFKSKKSPILTVRFHEVILGYNDGKYEQSLIYIDRIISEEYDQLNTYEKVIVHYYKSKILLELNHSLAFKNELTQLLNVSEKENFNSIEVKWAVNERCKLSKKEDLQSQIFWLDRLISVDKRLNETYKTVSQKLNKEFDLRTIEKEKKRLEKKLTSSKKQFWVWITFCLLIILIGSSYLLIKHFKRKKLKAALEEAPKQKKKEHSANKIISDDIASVVLTKLEDFEKNKRYLENVKLNELASELETNSSYLSKIINQHKNKNFKEYLNDLRVEYILEVLKKQPKFRQFRVEVLATECGFSSLSAFMRAFKAKTQMTPRAYIKSLSS